MTRKKIREIWKRKAGVSPIVAVVLMIAITIVLAATIYAWVEGFGGEETEEINADIGIYGVGVVGSEFHIFHNHGDIITNAFNPSFNGTIRIADWKNMQIEINGQILGTDAIGKAKIKPTIELNGANITVGMKDFKLGNMLAFEFDTPPTSGDVISVIYTPTDIILGTKIIVMPP